MFLLTLRLSTCLTFCLCFKSFIVYCQILELPSLYDFIACLSKTHFIKILHNPSHSLFKRLVFNNSRTPSRRPNTFRTAKAKTSIHQQLFPVSNEALCNSWIFFLWLIFTLHITFCTFALFYLTFCKHSVLSILLKIECKKITLLHVSISVNFDFVRQYTR